MFIQELQKGEVELKILPFKAINAVNLIVI
jgi:hypothetical protein